MPRPTLSGPPAAPRWPRGFTASTQGGRLVARYRHPDAALALVGLPFVGLVLGWMGVTVGRALVDVTGRSATEAAWTVGPVVLGLVAALAYGLLGVALNTTRLTVDGHASDPREPARPSAGDEAAGAGLADVPGGFIGGSMGDGPDASPAGAAEAVRVPVAVPRKRPVEVVVRPLPWHRGRRVDGATVRRVRVETRVEVSSSGGGPRSGSAALRRTTHHDVLVDTAAGPPGGDGPGAIRTVRLLSDTHADVAHAFARVLADALGCPVEPPA